MSDVSALPVHGEVFVDARGGDRMLRVNWHRAAGPDGLVVLSLWRGETCVGSFRLRARDVPLLVDVLARGVEPVLATQAGMQPGQFPPYDDLLGPPNATGAGNLSA